MDDSRKETEFISMRYCVSPIFASGNKEIEIEKNEYENLIQAKADLIEAILFEEKVQFLCSNYYDYESCILDLSLRRMMGEEIKGDIYQSHRGVLNKHIANLLSSSRTYLDHGSHHVKQISYSNSAMDEFDKQRNRHYDESLAYRVMEQLRNYTQHVGFPVHSITYKHSRDESERDESERDEKPKLRYSISPRINPTILIGDEVFKTNILNELLNVGKAVPITPMIREYVERLLEIHKFARGKINSRVSNSIEVIENKLTRLERELDQNCRNGFFLRKYNNKNDSKPAEETSLIKDFIERYNFLIKNNKDLKNLSIRYVSSNEY